MHVIFRESHGLEETETPVDLGQAAADLVVLSFSDSDLGAFAAGWHRGGGAEGRMPSLRLANLAALKHPLSVDTYVERTLDGARGILIRLIGGVPYWSYGLQQVEALARAKGIALAVLPADGRPDARLDAVSTVPASTLRRLAQYCDAGGAVAAQAALAQLALAAGLYAGPVAGAKGLSEVGAWTPEDGAACPLTVSLKGNAPLVLLVFYRSYLVAADLAPVETLTDALRARGFRVLGLFVPSLKAPDARGWLARPGRPPRPRRHRQRDVLLGARRHRGIAARCSRCPGLSSCAGDLLPCRMGRGRAWTFPRRPRHARRPPGGRRTPLRRRRLLQGARGAG
jgi:cobaltochelatase CobN